MADTRFLDHDCSLLDYFHDKENPHWPLPDDEKNVINFNDCILDDSSSMPSLELPLLSSKNDGCLPSASFSTVADQNIIDEWLSTSSSLLLSSSPSSKTNCCSSGDNISCGSTLQEQPLLLVEEGQQLQLCNKEQQEEAAVLESKLDHTDNNTGSSSSSSRVLLLSQKKSNNSSSSGGSGLMMLSPPCSSSSDGDIDVDSIEDYEQLFPELAGFAPVVQVEDTRLNENNTRNNHNVNCSRSEEDVKVFRPMMLNDGNNNHGDSVSSLLKEISEGKNDNVLRINVCRAVASKADALSPNDKLITSNFQHNYASHRRNDTGKNSAKVPKYAEFEPENGFAVCGPMSRNAILARENRRKKKEYVTTLESEIRTLKEQKEELSNGLQNANNMVDNLKDEVDYLKSIIANQTMIGALLQNIPDVAGINRKRAFSANASDETSKRHKVDHDYVSLSTTNSAPGVCLHVTDGSVSLEFCKQCNVKSTR